MNPIAHTPSHRRIGVGLLLSLVANAVLAALVWRQWHPMALPGLAIPARPLRHDVGTASANGPKPIAQANAARPAPTNPWQAVASGDYAATIALLRAAHCPEETIQDLIALRLSRDFEQRLRASIAQRRLGEDWWKADLARNHRADSRDAQALRAEMMLQFEELLGVTFHSAVGEFFPWMQSTDPDPVSLVHRRAYNDLLARHREEEAAFREQAGPSQWLDPKQEAALAALKQRQRSEIASLLTPVELQELELRDSPVASVVRSHFPEALSVDEYREMIRIAKELGYDDPGRWDTQASETNAEWAARTEVMRRQLKERLEQSLGRDRVTELDRAEAEQQQRDANLQSERNEQQMRGRMKEFGAGLGIEAAAVDRFMEQFKARAQELVGQNTGIPSDSEEGRKLQARIEAEARRIAEETLGDKADAFLKKFGDGGGE